MGASGWGSDHPVSDWLFDEAYRFEFFQAVRLLEGIGRGVTPVGEGVEPALEGIRFRSHVGLDFPASDVARVDRPKNGGQATMTVNFLGLAGHHGPMPSSYTETILDSVFRRDTAFRDFLDIFNHRLVSLMYRARKMHRPAFSQAPPDESHFARYFLSLIGLGTEGLRGSRHVPERALLGFTGLLAQKPRSAHGLQRLLSESLRSPVEVKSFSGGWHTLEASQTTALGSRNAELGQSVVLGSRVWDQARGFSIGVGPLRLGEFLNLLPESPKHRETVALTDFYVDRRHDYTLRLRVRSEEVPEARLSPILGPRLGWTSWLITRSPKAPDLEVAVRPRRTPPPLRVLRVPMFAELDRNDLLAIHRKMDVRHLETGTVVAREGEPARSLFIVRSGAVQLMGDAGGDGGVVLATLKSGDSFGEMDPSAELPRRYTAITAESSEILELTRKDLNELMASHPAIRKSVDEYVRRITGRTREAVVEEIAAMLNTLRPPLLESISLDGLYEVAEAARYFGVREGTILLENQTANQSLYLLCRGAARVDLHLPNGHLQTIGALEPGSVFGEDGVLYAKTRNISVAAVTDAEVLEITRPALDALIRRYPPFEHALRVFYFHRTQVRKTRRNGR